MVNGGNEMLVYVVDYCLAIGNRARDVEVKRGVDFDLDYKQAATSLFMAAGTFDFTEDLSRLSVLSVGEDSGVVVSVEQIVYLGAQRAG